MKKVMFVLSMLVISLSPLYSQSNPGTQETKPLPAKTFEVKGQVISSVTQKPIPKTIVMIAGTTTGTITDAKGTFTIIVPEGAKQLSFGSNGFNPLKVAIDTTKEMKIKLIPKEKK